MLSNTFSALPTVKSTSLVNTPGDNLANANAGVGIASTTMTGTSRIDNYEDYLNNHTTATDFTFAAKTPGTWANSLKVCFIDDMADQTIGITTDSLTTAGAKIGYAVTAILSNAVIPGAGTTSLFNGYLKGIITGVATDTTNSVSTIDVKVLSRVSSAGTETAITYEEGNGFAAFDTSDSIRFLNNSGIVTGHSASAAYTPPNCS